MQFQHLALVLSLIFGATSVQATQLAPVTSIQKDASIVKTVAAFKDREAKPVISNKTTLEQLTQAPKSETKTADERRIIASLSHTNSTFKRSKLNSFIQNLFGG